MPRIRHVKPEYFMDDDVAKCSIQARYLFIGLWTLADREGRLLDRPAKIKAHIFPYDDKITIKQVDNFLSELANTNFLVRFTSDEKQIIQIRSFKKHQHIHINEQSSQLPEYIIDKECTIQEPYIHPPSTALSSSSSSSSSSSKPTVTQDYLELMSAWNSLSGVRSIRDLNEKRKKNIRIRLKDANWNWRAAMDKFPLSCFPTPNGWLPNFDWFLRPDTVDRILEGSYDWINQGESKKNIVQQLATAEDKANYNPWATD
jgi:hypothetical protein